MNFTFTIYSDCNAFYIGCVRISFVLPPFASVPTPRNKVMDISIVKMSHHKVSFMYRRTWRFRCSTAVKDGGDGGNLLICIMIQ